LADLISMQGKQTDKEQPMPILVKIDGLDGHGDVVIAGYDGGEWFAADSFSYGVEREMKESGEKGGTADINIGVGELQECTISKSMDSASALLAQFAVNGNSSGGAQIDFVEVGASKPTVYLRYKLDRCFVKSWSTSGDADDRPTEEIAFYYNKIAFSVAGGGPVFSWDNVKKTRWTDHGLDPLPKPE
jgi:type VI protein secretion system component Hcp